MALRARHLADSCRLLSPWGLAGAPPSGVRLGFQVPAGSTRLVHWHRRLVWLIWGVPCSGTGHWPLPSCCSPPTLGGRTGGHRALGLCLQQQHPGCLLRLPGPRAQGRGFWSRGGKPCCAQFCHLVASWAYSLVCLFLEALVPHLWPIAGQGPQAGGRKVVGPGVRSAPTWGVGSLVAAFPRQTFPGGDCPASLGTLGAHAWLDAARGFLCCS